MAKTKHEKLSEENGILRRTFPLWVMGVEPSDFLSKNPEIFEISYPDFEEEVFKPVFAPYEAMEREENFGVIISNLNLHVSYGLGMRGEERLTADDLYSRLVYFSVLVSWFDNRNPLLKSFNDMKSLFVQAAQMAKLIGESTLSHRSSETPLFHLFPDRPSEVPTFFLWEELTLQGLLCKQWVKGFVAAQGILPYRNIQRWELAIELYFDKMLRYFSPDLDIEIPEKPTSLLFQELPTSQARLNEAFFSYKEMEQHLGELLKLRAEERRTKEAGVLSKEQKREGEIKNSVLG
jgi:hypothetical protein